MRRVGDQIVMQTGETVEVTGREWRGNARDSIVVWVRVVNPGLTELAGMRFWLTPRELELNAAR